MVSLHGKKIVLWDLDGTLIDSYGVYAAILTEAVTLSGLTMPEEQKLLKNFHGSLDESIKNALDLVDGEDFAKLLNDFLRIQEGYYEHPDEHLFTDAANVVEHCGAAGMQQIVVTNREHTGRGNASPRYLVKHSRLQQFIDDVISGDSNAYRKPDARVLEASVLLKNVNPDEVIVIGDQFVDAMLAQNIGSQAILINRSTEPIAHLDELGDDTAFLTIVSDLSEVIVG